MAKGEINVGRINMAKFKWRVEYLLDSTTDVQLHMYFQRQGKRYKEINEKNMCQKTLLQATLIM